MNAKNHITPVHFIGHALKNFVLKLTQNPDYYYNNKNYSRSKNKYRHNETMRWENGLNTRWIGINGIYGSYKRVDMLL